MDIGNHCISCHLLIPIYYMQLLLFIWHMLYRYLSTNLKVANYS